LAFHTPIPIKENKNKIEYNHRILTLGSCFSDNIGNILKRSKFHVDSNPFGVIFNSFSISQIINYIVDKREISESLYNVNHEKTHFHYDFSGQMNGSSKEEVATNINQSLNGISSKIDWVIITLGTSFVYELNAQSHIVNNCHKMPQSLFDKKILRIEHQFELLQSAISKLKRKNDNLQVIVTVSPIRHIKDGIVENNRSKARLLETAHMLTEVFDFVTYFPSYEIIMDELRDYRYYEKDLIHPNEVAIEHIFESFKQSYFSIETNTTHTEIQSYLNLLAHRPLLSHKVQLHESIVQDKFNLLSSKYPDLNWVH
jgi:hypothetical protein